MSFRFGLALLIVGMALTGCAEKKMDQAAAGPAATDTSNPPPLESLDASNAPADTPDPYARSNPPAGGQPPRAQPTNSGSRQDPGLSDLNTANDEVVRPSGADKSDSGSRTYVVQKGDTLSSISKKFYGDTSKWKRIQDANKARVPNANKLKVGTKLIIP